MKEILKRLIKGYKEELDQEDYYDYLLRELDRGEDQLLDAVRELDNEDVMYQLSKAVLAIQIAENQLNIENEPYEVKKLVVENKKYFQEHEIYNDLMEAATNRDRKALLKALNKIPGEYSKERDEFKYALDDTYEINNLRLRDELKRVFEEYEEFKEETRPKKYVVCTEKVGQDLELSGDSWDELETDDLDKANKEFMRQIRIIEHNDSKGYGVSILRRAANGVFDSVKHYAYWSMDHRRDDDGEIKSNMPYGDFLKRKVWTKEELTNRVLEELESLDEEIQNEYYDIYIVEDGGDNIIRLEEAGAGYGGERYASYKEVGTVDEKVVHINRDDLWV